jgi:hypothetical protein
MNMLLGRTSIAGNVPRMFVDMQATLLLYSAAFPDMVGDVAQFNHTKE